jgi:peptidoglycan/LPS O-acetylase OafA/YrhL
MSRRLSKRFAALTAGFTALAALFGILQAPAGMQDIGALAGLMFGFPMALVLAFLLRKKRPLVSLAAVGGAALVLAILPVFHDQLRNPFVHLAVLLVVGILLAMLLPNDKSLQDPSRCSTCDYPIGASDVCTECGRPHTVKPKEMAA